MSANKTYLGICIPKFMNIENKNCTKLIIWIVSLILIGSIIVIFSSSANANEENIVHKKLSLSESKQLLEDVQYLLSDKETIDYDDPKLNEILNKYEYDLFKIYKAFIEFDKSNKTKKDVDKAKKAISEILFLDVSGFSENFSQKIIESFLENMIATDIGSAIKNAVSDDLSNEVRTTIKIPLWLVLKYPDIMHYVYGRWALDVNANYSIEDLPAFKQFQNHIEGATRGRWDYGGGTIRIDYGASMYNLRARMSFTPSLLTASYYQPKVVYDNKPEDIPEFELSFTLWSYEGIWNRLKYKKVLKCFNKAADELTEYYSNNYNLAKYAAYSKLILSDYIRYEIPRVDLQYNSTTKPNYPDYYHYYQTIDELEVFKDDTNLIKNFSQNLTSKEKGFVLFYSIIKNYDIDFMQWLINSDADTNVIPCGETPLMASVRAPEVMKLLLKFGANIHIENRFGKNVLFYAAQFGNIEAVRILLKNGAKNIINSQIYDLETVEDTYSMFGDWDCPNPTIVNNFTPLVYAKRYANKEVVDLLIKHGAKNGPADPEEIKKWINQGPLDL